MHSSKPFVFDTNAPMIRITNQEILDGLRRYAAIHGQKPFGIKAFATWKDRPFEPRVAIKRFGSWRSALALVGIDGGRPRIYDAEELMVNLENVWRQMGRRPGVVQLARRGRCGYAPYRHRWGSVRRACELLAAHHRGEMTREELLHAGPGPRPRRKAIPRDLRWRILKRDHFRCAACGKSPATHPGIALEIDHIIPVSRGGTNDDANLRTLCQPCNQGKSDGN